MEYEKRNIRLIQVIAENNKNIKEKNAKIEDLTNSLQSTNSELMELRQIMVYICLINKFMLIFFTILFLICQEDRKSTTSCFSESILFLIEIKYK